ncbi:hypothetical protein H6G17_31785 [Chroococcidiopsis sp. FACHB-1243]|uniref:methyltransferase domain-containing protein n=1 Tax=Chroococcidiopsis sp. [FACHB-1243] TaxID=2692781 RepID=UPI001781CDA6|nr:methyltransferase domain-containing protein [Chroococcidiopsis sp. [FACHB-1243]]MBD2309982.1 hypothetical protein [Chroococcidiopsis sp. [FACHB-1243]]
MTIQYPFWLDYKTWSTPRWKCAIARRGLSMPMKVAVKYRVVEPSSLLLDFGCGRGEDLEHLHKLDISCVGFDPYWKYDLALLQPTDCISCIYVINTIESAIERTEVLQYCWELTRRSLVIAVRTDGRGEGLSRLGTYQKYYSQAEFRSFIAQSLGVVRVEFPKSGIAFIQKK